MTRVHQISEPNLIPINEVKVRTWCDLDIDGRTFGLKRIISCSAVCLSHCEKEDLNPAVGYAQVAQAIPAHRCLFAGALFQNKSCAVTSANMVIVKGDEILFDSRGCQRFCASYKSIWQSVFLLHG